MGIVFGGNVMVSANPLEMMRFRSPAVFAVVVVSALVAVAGCSSDGGADPVTTPLPVPTNPPTTEAVANASTTTGTTVAEATTTTSSTTSTTATTQPPPTLPPTTATTEPAQPSVSTLVPEADPELLSQKHTNPDDINNNRPLESEHVPIIEAYLAFIQGSYEVYSTAPLDPEDPRLDALPSTADALDGDRAGLRRRASIGQVLNADQGVTFRPWIAGPVGDTAVLYDCELAGHYWEIAATREPVPPNQVWVGTPGTVVEIGVRYNMVSRDGQWLVGSGTIDEVACQ